MRLIQGQCKVLPCSDLLVETSPSGRAFGGVNRSTGSATLKPQLVLATSPAQTDFPDGYYEDDLHVRDSMLTQDLALTDAGHYVWKLHSALIKSTIACSERIYQLYTSVK